LKRWSLLLWQAVQRLQFQMSVVSFAEPKTTTSAVTLRIHLKLEVTENAMLLGPMLGAMQHVQFYNNWPFRGERRQPFFDHQVLQSNGRLEKPIQPYSYILLCHPL